MPDAIVKEHSREIFGYLCRFTGVAEVAQDVLSEVYVKLIEQYNKVKDAPFDWRPWLYRVATNTAISHKRRSKVRALFGIAKKETVLFSESPESAVEIGVQGNKVRAAIDKLGSKHKAIIIMRFYQDLSYEEMAAVLKINVGTVKSRLSEAKLKIGGLLEGEI